MAGACGDHATMDPGAFSSHIKELATQIKDSVAKTGADTVLSDAQFVSMHMQSYLEWDDYEKAEAAGTANEWESKRPYPIPADGGYSVLPPAVKEMVDSYQTNYQVDLLRFDAGTRDEAESQLKEHLSWIVDKFDRGGSLPNPTAGDSAISVLETMAGGGEMVETSIDSEGNASVDSGTTIASSELATAVTADVAGIKDTVAPWKSGAADAFKHFIKKIPTAGTNQINAIIALRNLLELHKAVVTWGRHDVDAIAHDGLEAVKSFDKCCDNDADIFTYLKIGLGVAAIVGGIATFPAGGSGVAVFAAGVGLISSTVNTAATIDGINQNEYRLGADDLDGVVTNISEALDETYTKLDEGYTEIGTNGFTKVNTTMTGSATNMCAPRPGAGSDGVAFPDATTGDVEDTVN